MIVECIQTLFSFYCIMVDSPQATPYPSTAHLKLMSIQSAPIHPQHQDYIKVTNAVTAGAEKG